MDRLNRKKFEIACYDKDRFGKELIGRTEISLHAIATGPIRFELPLVDGGHVAGRVSLDIEMEQKNDVAVQMQGVELEGGGAFDDAARGGDLYLAYAFTGVAHPEDSCLKTRPGSVTRWEYLDLLYINGSLRTIVENGVYFWVRRRVRLGKDEDLANGHLDFSAVFSFTDGDAKDFSVPLRGAEGVLAGSIFFNNVPMFSQSELCRRLRSSAPRVCHVPRATFLSSSCGASAGLAAASLPQDEL